MTQKLPPFSKIHRCNDSNFSQPEAIAHAQGRLPRKIDQPLSKLDKLQQPKKGKKKTLCKTPKRHYKRLMKKKSDQYKKR